MLATRAPGVAYEKLGTVAMAMLAVQLICLSRSSSTRTQQFSVATRLARPPAAIPALPHSETTANPPAASRRVAAVQRALTEYGYGQLKPTGTVGSDTHAAIQKFERERKIPVTGQISDRLVRELIAMIGRPIE